MTTNAPAAEKFRKFTDTDGQTVITTPSEVACVRSGSAGLVVLHLKSYQHAVVLRAESVEKVAEALGVRAEDA